MGKKQIVPKKMCAHKKAAKKHTHSYIDKQGRAYYKNVPNDPYIIALLRGDIKPTPISDGAENQNLVSKGPNSAASITLKKAWKELGY
jgi:hypothetical protein